MKSKFKHNQQLISELYGNFSRNKLLSEAFTDTFSDDQEKIITNGKHSDHNSSLFDSVG